MPKKSTAGFIFALADIAIGAVLILFFAVGALVLPQIKPLEPFSTPFFISLAFPVLVLITGIVNLRRTTYSYVFTFFVSFFAGIYLLVGMLEKNPPYYLAADAPPFLALLFHYLAPGAAIAYFAAHSLASFIAMKNNKTAEEPAPASTILPRAEIFCARCQARVKETDEACPSCGELLSGWRCAACGYEGRKSEFRDDRCPKCGKEMTQE